MKTLQEYMDGLGKKDSPSDKINVLNNFLFKAAKKNNLQDIKKILSLTICDTQSVLEFNLDYPFYLAAEAGSFDVVQFLLNFQENYFGLDDTRRAFRQACEGEHLSILKLLVNNSDPKNVIILNDDNYDNIRVAVMIDKVESIKYLVTSPELKACMNVHVKNDTLFKDAVICNATNIINYLIFEYRIQKTDEIKKFCHEKNYSHINQLFENRDLNDKLNEDLLKSENNLNKKKI